ALDCGHVWVSPERSERLGELSGIFPAFARLAPQTLRDDVREPLRDFRIVLVERDRFLLENRCEDLPDAVPVERRLACKQLVRDDAERPDVGARIDLGRIAKLLGRHVHGRSEHVMAGEFLVLWLRVLRFRYAEVEELDCALPIRSTREEEVGW